MSKHAVGHIGCPHGKRCRLILRDGRRVDGRFAGRTDRHVLLDGGRRVAIGDLKTFLVLPKQRGV